MENKDKIGNAISDKQMKTIKKLVKDQVFIGPENLLNVYYDSDLKGVKIKIANIRKYKHARTRWSDNQEQYAYEIDVIVDMNTTDYYRSNYRCQSKSRMFNGWYRSSILGILNSESNLKYCNIDVKNESVISKITYKEIV